MNTVKIQKGIDPPESTQDLWLKPISGGYELLVYITTGWEPIREVSSENEVNTMLASDDYVYPPTQVVPDKIDAKGMIIPTSHFVFKLDSATGLTLPATVTSTISQWGLVYVINPVAADKSDMNLSEDIANHITEIISLGNDPKYLDNLKLVGMSTIHPCKIKSQLPRNITSLDSLFVNTNRSDAEQTISGIENWNTSNILSLENTFANSYFNLDISSWDVSKVTTMNSLFFNDRIFNQPIGKWNVKSLLCSYSNIFGGDPTIHYAFSQDLSSWKMIYDSVPGSYPITWALDCGHPEYLPSFTDADIKKIIPQTKDEYGYLIPNKFIVQRGTPQEIIARNIDIFRGGIVFSYKGMIYVFWNQGMENSSYVRLWTCDLLSSNTKSSILFSDYDDDSMSAKGIKMNIKCQLRTPQNSNVIGACNISWLNIGPKQIVVNNPKDITMPFNADIFDFNYYCRVIPKTKYISSISTANVLQFYAGTKIPFKYMPKLGKYPDIVLAGEKEQEDSQFNTYMVTDGEMCYDPSDSKMTAFYRTENDNYYFLIATRPEPFTTLNSNLMITNFGRLAANDNQLYTSVITGKVTYINAKLPYWATVLHNIFNGDCTPVFLKHWDTSKITDLTGAFMNSHVNDSEISSWDVSNVLTLTDTFHGCDKFNQPLNNWNVSKVTSMNGFLQNAVHFNQSLDKWANKISTCKDFTNFLNGATDFDQDLSSWIIPAGVTTTGMLKGTKIYGTSKMPKQPS